MYVPRGPPVHPYSAGAMHLRAQNGLSGRQSAAGGLHMACSKGATCGVKSQVNVLISCSRPPLPMPSRRPYSCHWSSPTNAVCPMKPGTLWVSTACSRSQEPGKAMRPYLWGPLWVSVAAPAACLHATTEAQGLEAQGSYRCRVVSNLMRD